MLPYSSSMVLWRNAKSGRLMLVLIAPSLTGRLKCNAHSVDVCDVVYGWWCSNAAFRLENIWLKWVGNDLNPQGVWCYDRLQTIRVKMQARNKGDRITCPCLVISCVRSAGVNSTKEQQFACNQASSELASVIWQRVKLHATALHFAIHN